VESHNYLGIHVSRESATVVCVQGQDRSVLGCFSVSLESDREKKLSTDMSDMARLIADGVSERDLSYVEAVVAIDCSLFMQHSIHSEFKDRKQISQTVKFDTEESLSSDISEVAVAFKVLSSNETGSQLNVLTAERKVLSAILLGLQASGIDPVIIEPDVDSLSRFAVDKVSVPSESRRIIGFLSDRSGYLISLLGSDCQPGVRTFLIGGKQDRNRVLSSQIPLTIATVGSVDGISVVDSRGQVDVVALGERLGIGVEQIEAGVVSCDEQEKVSKCGDVVSFAVAYGAACSHFEKGEIANFRDDFMPFEGKKRRMEKTLKFLSVSVSILMVSLGILVTSQLLGVNKYRSQLREKFSPEYTKIMRTKNMEETFSSATRKLQRLEGRLKRDAVPGGAGEITTKLVSIFTAINKTAKQAKLRIDSITVGGKSITLIGDTSSLKNSQAFWAAVKATNLGEITETFESVETGRHKFKITINTTN
jgi:hypothetical protein